MSMLQETQSSDFTKFKFDSNHWGAHNNGGLFSSFSIRKYLKGQIWVMLNKCVDTNKAISTGGMHKRTQVFCMVLCQDWTLPCSFPHVH